MVWRNGFEGNMEDVQSNKKTLVVVLPMVTIIVAIVMMLLSGVNYWSGEDLYQSFSGFEVIFGLKEVASSSFVTTTSKILNFSIIAFLSLLFPFFGSILQFFSNRIIRSIALVLTLAGVVLMFMMPSFVVFSSESLALMYHEYSFTIGIGSIISGIVLCIQSVIIGYEILS